MRHSYRPTYHASVPSGWSNDPNGTIFYSGRAHLFFQHYPYKPEWGTMHWGHFVTDDFIRWECLPVALRPDEPYEAVCGCCSGSTYVRDGRLYMMYTAAQPDLQRQCLAVSDDGVRFEKAPDNPVIVADDISPEIARMDFRDPRVFCRDGRWYLLAGARILPPGAPRPQAAPQDEECEAPRSPSAGSLSAGALPTAGTLQNGYGNLVLLAGDGLREWTYVGRLLRETPRFDPAYFHLDGVYECPDYFVLDGTEVLLSSPQNLPRMGNAHQNVHSALYMLGRLDFGDGHFDIDAIGDIDAGFDFYAPQTLRMPDGRVIMIAWKEMWDRNYPTQAEGWAGTYTLPRELRVRDGRLIQLPVRELEAFRRNGVRRESVEVGGEPVAVEGVSGTALEIRVTLEPGTAARAGLKLFAGKVHETRVYYDRDAGALVFDRSRSGLPLRGREADVDRRVCDVGRRERIDLRLFLDVSSVEVFADGGRYVMTGNVYPDPEDVGIRFYCEGGRCRFVGLEKYDIVV